MKRLASTGVVISALLLLAVAGLMLANPAKANYYPPPSIEISSPIPAPGVNTNDSVPLYVRVNVLAGESDITFIRYSLDGKANVTLTNLAREDNVWYWTTTKGVTVQGTAFRVEASLDDLADGKHLLWIYSHDAQGKEMSRSLEFTVDTHDESPELLMLSPQNETYPTTEVPLTFAITEPILSANYMLDNQVGNVSQSFTGNSTLTGLSKGMHKISVTVWTEKGHSSQTIYFSISEEANENTSILDNAINIVAVAVAVCVGVSAGLLVYFRKRQSRL